MHWRAEDLGCTLRWHSQLVRVLMPVGILAFPVAPMVGKHACGIQHVRLRLGPAGSN